MDSILAFEQDPIWSVLLRFIVTIAVDIVILRFIYYRFTKDKDNLIFFFQMGIMIFLICILLITVEIDLGVALGLFAIFAILRFRSENISTRNLTYLFTVIGVSVINSMATFYNPVRGPILINLIIIISLFLLEMIFSSRKPAGDRVIDSGKTVIIYDRLELLDPERIEELISDISSRTYNRVEKVRLRKIDLNKGVAELEIFFIREDRVAG